MKRLVALLRMRCPVCLQGKTFHSLFGMYKTCPECGVVFEREHGYYLNSMFIAYGLGFLIVVPSAVLLAMRQVSIAFFSIFMVLEVIVIWPLVFRYSRVIWLHLDQVMDPRAAPGESVQTEESIALPQDSRPKETI